MRPIRSARLFLLPLLVGGLLGSTAAAVASTAPKDHPRLVNLETTRCETCHASLLEGKAFVHPPVADDCTTCHEMTLGDEGTTVALMEAEPGLCIFCHDDKSKAVEGELETPHFPVTDSCLNCHSPHASDQPHVLLEPVPQLCSTCHDMDDLQQVHGNQITDSTNCASCHQPHGSDQPRMLLAKHLHPPFAEGSCDGCHRQPFGNRVRLRVRGEKLCEACHGDMGADGRDKGGTVHGALIGERGRAGCLNCHNPHMSDQAKLLLQPRPALCGECHSPIVDAALAETGHYPAAEDCLNCHQPHASPQKRLLNEPLGDLCVSCHDPEDSDLVATHLGANLADLTCVECHTPHGDGNPKLLARVVHPPVLDGCDTCHEGAWNQQMEGGSSELCLLCHDDIGEIAAKAPVPHPALEVARCADCHNPHASAQDHLVKSPGAGPCADCHDEKVARPEETAHGIIDLVGCRACHEPHGGTKPQLLRTTGNELCLSCHASGAIKIAADALKVTLPGGFEVDAEAARDIPTLQLSNDGLRGHPVTGHRVLGAPTAKELKIVDTNFKDELACLSCHDPHKGRVKLLRWGAQAVHQACLQCHPK